MSRDGKQPLAAGAMTLGQRLSEGRPEFVEGTPGCHGDRTGPVATDLGSKPGGVFAGRQSNHLYAVGMSISDGERARADRAGRTENRDPLLHGVSSQIV